jgi:Glycosyl transferases group 1
MRILLWHVHGSWTTAFVQGRHDYLLPVLPDRGPDGRGRARTWQWPGTVVELSPVELHDTDIDVVVAQRPHELELARQWTGRALPTVYLEHNAPEPHPVHSRHPLADRPEIPLVHVTHFNELCWDNGRAPTRVIEHGVVDPGALYTGDIAHAAVVVNEPDRRGRMVGADLFDRFARAVPLDVYGMGAVGTSERISAHGDVRQHAMHGELARRRVYLHTTRWTSLGLALVEAMHLGMPVVALATTEAVEAVPQGAGVVSTDVARLCAALRDYVNDPEAARLAGKAARAYALHRYGLVRFLDDWDRVLKEVIT